MIALTAMLLFSACVKEKTEICYSGLLMHYHYDLNPDRTNRFGSDVDKLTILAFDENDLFYQAFEVAHPDQLTDDNLIWLDLPDGKWTIVSWGGDMNTYDMGILNEQRDVSVVDYFNGTRGSVTLADHRVWLNNFVWIDSTNKLVTDDISHLFYGQVTATATTSTRQVPHTEVQMMRNTNTLSIQIEGLPADTEPGRTRAHQDNITVTADMVNGRCRADNEICLDALNIRYAQTHAISSTETTLDTDLKVMRIFVDDDDSVITLSGTFLEHHGYPDGRIDIPLVDTILESPEYNTQEDLDRENHYEFLLSFDSDMGLTITVNGWKVKEVTVPQL
jgi:hypothetical protein